MKDHFELISKHYFLIFYRPGTKYEIAVSNADDKNVLAKKLFLSEPWIDLKVFSGLLRRALLAKKNVMVNNSYQSGKSLTSISILPNEHAVHYKILVQYKTCRARLKIFSI